MSERPVIADPFEVVALDLVGPVPKGKGEVEYMLTAICMATRWPEAVPLRSVMARAVADAVIDIFGRIGLALQITTDNGVQFISKLMNNLTDLLGVERL